MKNLITAAIIAIVSIPAIAAEPLPVNAPGLPDCGVIAAMARMTMTSRQNGLPLTKYFELTDQTIKGEADNRLIKAIAVRAYEHPLMNVAMNKATMTTEFESEIFVACLKSRSSR